MVFAERVAIHPKVMLGKPVIRETRTAVELILRKLAEVSSEADLLDAYPRFTREDVRAAIAYAAEMVAKKRLCHWSCSKTITASSGNVPCG